MLAWPHLDLELCLLDMACIAVILGKQNGVPGKTATA